MKYFSTSVIIREIEIIVEHPLNGWSLSLTMPSSGKDVENKISRIPQVGCKTIQSLWRTFWTVTLKVRHMPAIWPNHSSPRCFPWDKRKHLLLQSCYKNVQYIFICDSPTCPSTGEWIKENEVCLYCGILLSHKQEQAINTHAHQHGQTSKLLCWVTLGLYIWF